MSLFHFSSSFWKGFYQEESKKESMSKVENNFFERVYEVVEKIPFGKVTTYGAIARYLGSGKSARIVGWALKASPKNLPAHRVVNKTGLLSGKHGFEEVNTMEKRLKKEDIKIEREQIKNFSLHFWDPFEINIKSNLFLSPTRENDFPKIVATLEKNGLPTEGVRSENTFFFSAKEGKSLLGFCGIECYKTKALLRSFVIFELKRRKGYGDRMLTLIERQSFTEYGVKTLFLLTENAVPFFEERGYEPIERENVPKKIKTTNEFSTLCPESAITMKKKLELY